MIQDVTVTEVIRHHRLYNMTPEIDTDRVYVTVTDLNRPAFPLAGFFAHFDNKRIQVIGLVEAEYIRQMSEEEKLRIFDQFLSKKFPALVYCRSLKPDELILDACRRHGVPCLISPNSTTDLQSELIRWLKVKLAPMISIHGVLVDVFGEGVLIMGESGVGKSEAALELVKRGHRLVSDDVVEIRKVSDVTLIGNAPDITKHFIELRGIGIIDVRALFGTMAVKDTQSIDLVIKLEDWNKDRDYDRLGMEDQYTEFLGNKVTCNILPIRPGRNLAIILESAAVNHRQKKMGYNAAKELYKRVQHNIVMGSKRRDEENLKSKEIEEREAIHQQISEETRIMCPTPVDTVDLESLPKVMRPENYDPEEEDNYYL